MKRDFDHIFFCTAIVQKILFAGVDVESFWKESRFTQTDLVVIVLVVVVVVVVEVVYSLLQWPLQLTLYYL